MNIVHRCVLWPLIALITRKIVCNLALLYNCVGFSFASNANRYVSPAPEAALYSDTSANEDNSFRNHIR